MRQHSQSPIRPRITRSQTQATAPNQENVSARPAAIAEQRNARQSGENQNSGQQTQNNMNNVSNTVRASLAGSEMRGSIMNNMNIGMNGNNGINNGANTGGNGSNDINMNSAGENATANVSTGAQGGGVQGLGQPARGDGH